MLDSESLQEVWDLSKALRKILVVSIVVTIGALFLAIEVSSEETVPTELMLLVREREVLVFDGVRGTWVAENILSGERVIDRKADGHVAVVVTNYRVLGYSADTNFWASIRLISGEGFISLAVQDNVATVVTGHRALGFSARRGQWIETKLHLK
ncbi:MAG: hypothetical protein HY730_04210 [Candidatus Tectomicrobia bacterium]|uniref:EH domain-containing protein n=1 Tax=Tectimicrobiota bacterium TaxID=2528274 RepID=A0A933GN28_UNCTE|nr:hypothetical protein [Candidatus Tectomicrobia bacterium]